MLNSLNLLITIKYQLYPIELCETYCIQLNCVKPTQPTLDSSPPIITIQPPYTCNIQPEKPQNPIFAYEKRFT